MSRFRRRLMGLAALGQAAADDFVRVEYIENTSHTAYIDTKIIANQNTNYEIKVQFTKNTGYPYIFGSQYATKDRRFSLMEGSYNTFYYISNLHKQEINLSLTAEQQTANLTIKKDGLNIYIDDVKAGSFTNTTFTTPTSLTIFTCHFANGGIDTGHQFFGRFYYMKIYDGTTLVRDFIPMYQKSRDRYGLWDRVEKRFYTSPNGVKFTGGERYDTTDIIEVHPKLIANTFINENTGVQQNYGGWSSSDYIDVEGFKYIYVQYPFSQMNYKYGAYYDKDKRRISNTSSFVIPSNAKYVRLSTSTASFTNVWLFKRQFTTSNVYQNNHYIETDGSIRAYNGWNIFNTESVYNYFCCFIYAQSYRYQASYNADGSVYQSGKGLLERPEGGKVLLSDNRTSITYYAGYNYEYKNMNE